MRYLISFVSHSCTLFIHEIPWYKSNSNSSEGEESLNLIVSHYGDMADYLGTILIVDDDKNILGTFTKILKRKGYSVVSHETGKEAINDKTAYDVALIDYRLANMEGTDVAAGISANTTFIISGSPSEELKKKAKSAGVSGVYSKPVQIEMLLSDIERSIAKKKQ